MTNFKMKNKRKGIVAMAAAAALTAVLPITTVFGADENDLPSVQFQIGSLQAIGNNGAMKLAVAPYMEKGTAMVPVRALAEGLDAAIDWDPLEKTIHLTRGGLTVALKAGDDTAAGTFVKNTKLPAKVTVTRGHAFVPANSVAQLLGSSTNWEAATKKVTVKVNGEEAGVISESYSFDRGDEGWLGGFADLPVEYDPSIYELSYARELIAIEGNTTNYALKLNGMNRSDDLFMYTTQKISGLKPDTVYDAALSFSLYTNQAGDMMGVGGAPGEAVSIKAGFASKEPEVTKERDGENTYFKLNLDKGNQSTEGDDLKIVGNMVKPDSDTEGFQQKTMSHAATLKTNASGELFVIIGSDSGYEGLTTYYVDDIQVTLTPGT
ncbi:copper amine oxidase N-terminal domain-containing protein [Paenibacillus harenae]|uniref:copper amine oxidase N-terminal domain-containing protein n=1 Tax=Paenibacillus harenae TaxID=306543 RepID=UPI0004207C41|nr:copper amine oxidase N-terminal domain-containing protein [Paenibacillus harenae]